MLLRKTINKLGPATRAARLLRDPEVAKVAFSGSYFGTVGHLGATVSPVSDDPEDGYRYTVLRELARDEGRLAHDIVLPDCSPHVIRALGDQAVRNRLTNIENASSRIKRMVTLLAVATAILGPPAPSQPNPQPHHGSIVDEIKDIPHQIFPVIPAWGSNQSTPED